MKEGPAARKGKARSGKGKEDPDLVNLALRARRYEPEAFAELFDLYFEDLRRYMYYQTGNLETSEELAAEVFSTALQRIESFDDRGGTIRSWLYGIARNLVARHRERLYRQPTTALDEGVSAPEEESPEAVAISAATHEQLYDALRRLPDDQRDVVILRFIDGHRVGEVAEMLGKKAGAVRALQFRAISSLRKQFRLEEGA